MWPDIHRKVIEVKDEVSECKRMWMRWTIGLVEYGSRIARKDERESEDIRNLRGEMKVVRCERQVKIAFSSAVNMEAVFRVRKDEMVP